MKRLIISSILFYKNISQTISAYQIAPFFYSGCRHFPTCSEYAVIAINKYGIIKGSGKAFIRILKCNPLSHKFYDPV